MSKIRKETMEDYSYEGYAKRKVAESKMNQALDITAKTQAFIAQRSKILIHPLRREIGLFIAFGVAKSVHPAWYQTIMFVIVRSVGRIRWIGKSLAGFVAVLSSLPLHYLGFAIHKFGLWVVKSGVKFDIEAKHANKVIVKVYTAKSFQLGWKLIETKAIKS